MSGLIEVVSEWQGAGVMCSGGDHGYYKKDVPRTFEVRGTSGRRAPEASVTTQERGNERTFL